MVFDQVAVRGLPITHCCEVPGSPFAHEGLDLGGRHAGDAPSTEPFRIVGK